MQLRKLTPRRSSMFGSAPTDSKNFVVRTWPSRAAKHNAVCFKSLVPRGKNKWGNLSNCQCLKITSLRVGKNRHSLVSATTTQIGGSTQQNSEDASDFTWSIATLSHEMDVGRQKLKYWGGPSWWAWFWQLARLLKTELLLLVIIRHLHLRPSRSSVS